MLRFTFVETSANLSDSTGLLLWFQPALGVLLKLKIATRRTGSLLQEFTANQQRFGPNFVDELTRKRLNLYNRVVLVFQWHCNDFSQD